MAPQTSVSLLVMDDDPRMASGLVRILHRDGSTVETASNG
jgi:hypothetical protein